LAGDGGGVLVVSDSDVLRDLLTVILKQQGFRVTAFARRGPAQEAVVARRVSSVVADVRPVAAEGRSFAAWLASCGLRMVTVLVVDRGEGGDLARDLGAKVLSAQTLERGGGADWTGWLRPGDPGEGRA
jgi:DNA-binding response OmpR family regulator